MLSRAHVGLALVLGLCGGCATTGSGGPHAGLDSKGRAVHVNDKLPYVEPNDGPQPWTPPRAEPGARYVIVVKDGKGPWRVDSLDPAPGANLPPNGERLLVVPDGPNRFRVEPGFQQATIRAGSNLFECAGDARPRSESYTPCDSAFAKNYFFGDGWIGRIKNVDRLEIVAAMREANVLDALAQSPRLAPVDTSGMDPLKAVVIERLKQSQPKAPDDPEIQAMEAEAWQELKGTPKRVRGARNMTFYYKGFTNSIGAALRGEANPPPPSAEHLAIAEQWNQRIAEACRDASTLDCGSEIVVNERGGLADVMLQGTDDGSTAQAFTISVQPMNTPRFLRKKRELSAIAGTCGVSGLGFGARPPGKAFDGRRTTVTWPRLKDRFRELSHAEPTLLIDCPLTITLPKHPTPGQPLTWTADGANTILVRGKQVPVSYVMLRVEANWLAVLATGGTGTEKAASAAPMEPETDRKAAEKASREAEARKKGALRNASQ